MTALAAATKDVLKSTGVDGDAGGRHRARHDRLQRDSGGRRAWSRSTSTTSGAIIAPSPRPRRSRARRTSWASRASSGAAASTRTSGASPSCCTGCATTRRSARGLSRRSSIATWSPPRSAASPHVERAEAQRLRHGPQVDVESQVGRAAAGGVSRRRGSAACRRARQDRRRVSHQRSSRRASLAEVGRGARPARGNPHSRSAHSTRTGTRSAPTSARATR